jgi:hypothetical protein
MAATVDGMCSNAVGCKIMDADKKLQAFFERVIQTYFINLKLGDTEQEAIERVRRMYFISIDDFTEIWDSQTPEDFAKAMEAVGYIPEEEAVDPCDVDDDDDYEDDEDEDDEYDRYDNIVGSMQFENEGYTTDFLDALDRESWFFFLLKVYAECALNTPEKNLEEIIAVRHMVSGSKGYQYVNVHHALLKRKRREAFHLMAAIVEGDTLAIRETLLPAYESISKGLQGLKHTLATTWTVEVEE